MYQLKVIVASTRPGRKGPAIAKWFMDMLHEQSEFEVELIDLKELNLPFMDEPEPPRLRKYQHEHTKAWSRKIEAADAFVFVTPEYNFGFPATLKNALDFLYQEWTFKPVGFVSYGGMAGGTRAVQMLKQVVTSMKMVPLLEAVHISYFTKYINEEEQFIGDEGHVRMANGMLKELQWWTNKLKG
ncbi:NAD(P)H-dependent oxidoreductase [Pedobacter gandavensis]|uniref:NADPH-dependent FMN reductase n=1 Tax=Pedobacter gandavensis TaxID=2679963 RepID=UPI00292F03B8|nr:NAD(P)H-dependent oxidoreductase [Pedobacter gandavensis]